MAKYLTTLLVKRPIEETFAFVSNFHNAATWDPRTYSAEKYTPGPVGLGTIFILRGGMLPKGTLPSFTDRFVAQPLPYEIKVFTPPRRFVLVGQTPQFDYRDDLDFTAEGDHTRLQYAATLSFRGIFRLGEPVLRLLFQRIGDDATRHLARAVEAATPARTTTADVAS
ncbi:MAG: SRPBCC family protein [Deltaproteobacteria bacterium]|nr:SRPBCC family protein [Deltaproteobacteria bacterium]